MRRYSFLLILVLIASLLLAACGQQPDSNAAGTEVITDSSLLETEQAPTNAVDSTLAATEPQQAASEATEPEQPVEKDPLALFENAAFIGDSVTLKLRNYNMSTNAMGDVLFLCQGSYSAAHAVNNTMLLSYRGEDMTPQDALKESGVEKVFILLGMNDIALHGIDKTIENWGALIGNIRSTCPDITIYIQSGTPIYKDGEVGSLTNENMDAYNVKLQQFAKENDCYYLDIATQYKNASNGLATAYCSDEFVHFTDLACKMWIEKLLELAA